MILATLALAAVSFQPTDIWSKLPETDYLYICGKHDSGPGHANLPLHSNMTVDFDCPGNPGSIEAPNWDHGLSVVDAHDVTILNPRISGSGRAILIQNSARVRIVGGELHHTTSVAAIQVVTASQDVSIERVWIHDAWNGIYFHNDPSERAGHLRCRIIGNRIEDIYGSRDSHAIGMQTVSGCLIAHNVLTRTDGPALAVYWWNGAHEMQDNVIEDNTISDIRNSHRPTSKTTVPTGMDLGGSNGPGSGRYNNRVRRNTIRAVDGDALYLKGSITPPGLYPLEVTDNYVSGSVRYGVADPRATRAVYLRNQP